MLYTYIYDISHREVTQTSWSSSNMCNISISDSTTKHKKSGTKFVLGLPIVSTHQ